MNDEHEALSPISLEATWQKPMMPTILTEKEERVQFEAQQILH